MNGLVEDSDGVRDTWEDAKELRLLLTLLNNSLHVLGELVEEMTSNITGDDLDALIVGLELCLLVNSDIETQHHSILFGFL